MGLFKSVSQPAQAVQTPISGIISSGGALPATGATPIPAYNDADGSPRVGRPPPPRFAITLLRQSAWWDLLLHTAPALARLRWHFLYHLWQCPCERLSFVLDLSSSLLLCLFPCAHLVTCQLFCFLFPCCLHLIVDFSMRF